MSKNEMIDKHYKKIESITKSWNEAIETAKNRIRKDFIQKRNDLKEKLNKSKNEEQELIGNYQRNEIQYNKELNKIANQIQSLESQLTPTEDTSVNTDLQRKNQQIDQILADTHKEVAIVVDRHKDRVKRLEQILTQNILQEKKFTQLGKGLSGNQNANTIKNIIDMKNKNMNDVINKLDSIRGEIEKKIKQLIEFEKKETEDIVNAEKECFENEAKERKEEMNRFLTKAKDLIKK